MRQVGLTSSDPQQDLALPRHLDLSASTLVPPSLPTGTANGGSAILWSSIMELSGLDDSKIITIDVDSPVWKPDENKWGGKARGDPTEDRLWKKRVTFIKVRRASLTLYGPNHVCCSGQEGSNSMLSVPHLPLLRVTRWT